jgi:hypothetical protein
MLYKVSTGEATGSSNRQQSGVRRQLPAQSMQCMQGLCPAGRGTTLRGIVVNVMSPPTFHWELQVT